MKQRNEIQPPRWATRLLHWYCRPELAEDLEGDLTEYFHRNLQRSRFRAKLIYVVDVLKFLRPYTLRKPRAIQTVIHWLMIGSYLKTSGRYLIRNKLFSTINIFGLAVSLSIGLMMVAVLHEVKSYDQFHVNHNRIYRLATHFQFLDHETTDLATGSLRAGRLIHDTFSQPEAVAILQSGFGGDMTYGTKTIPAQGYWTNEDFFKVFSFKLKSGNPQTALREPYSVVLTETTAAKFFASNDPIGQALRLNDRDYQVTGILEDVPYHSHMRFEMLGSLKSKEPTETKEELEWDNVWYTWTYMLLPEGTDLEKLQSSLNAMATREDATVKNTHIKLSLQPLDNIMSGPDYSNSIGPTMGQSTLWVFGALTFVVILSAVFNYTNLSVARSLSRTREVGIRKVIGAMKSHVRAQFIIEALIIALGSLVLAFGLFLLIRPFLLGLNEDLSEILKLELNPGLIGWFVVLALVTGVIAGLFPALFFSRINAIAVLKNMALAGGAKKLTFRKALIVFQYIISIAFITGSAIAYRQYRHFITFDLGFQTENIINVALQGNKPEIVRKAFEEIPEVREISQSAMVTSVGNYWTTFMKNPADPLDSSAVNYNSVDQNYFPVHGHQLLAGRNFNTLSENAAEGEIIINEEVIKRFKIGDGTPAGALDQTMIVERKPVRIVGVMRNFHYGRANDRQAQQEVIFRYNPGRARLLNIKIQSNDLLATHDRMAAAWKSVDPVHPFEAKFYRDQVEQGFKGLIATVKVAGVLAALAISIASLGLLGMVVFTTESRVREISIRKVLGAGEWKLALLLGKSFILLLAIAAVIGISGTTVFFQEVLFPELGNPAPIYAIDLLGGVILIVSIALIMIITQTLKVARSNPAEVLKSE